MSIRTAALALTALTSSAVAAPDDDWFADYDAAVAAAREQKKDLLVDFTGSDWCRWCIQLHKEVFAHDEFLDPAMERYVLVSLDFPHDAELRASVPNPDRNRELGALHRVSGYPTILLMTADGDVYGRTGYQSGGPQAYLEHLDELRTAGRGTLGELDAAIAAADEAEGDARAAAVERLVETFRRQAEGSAFAGKLAAAVVERVDALPGESRLGVLEEVIAAGLVDEAVVRRARELDPKNEKGTYFLALRTMLDWVRSEAQVPSGLRAIDTFLKDGIVAIPKDEVLMLCARGAQWSAQIVGDAEGAERYARRGLELTEDPQLVAYFRSLVTD